MEENKAFKVISVILALSIAITIITANVVSITGITLLRNGPAVGVVQEPESTTEVVPAGETQPDETVSPDDTTPASDTVQVTGSAGTNQTAAKTTTTTKAVTQKAKTKADAAKLFNDAVNKTKAYKGNVKIKRVEGITAQVTDANFFIKAAASLALGGLNSYPETREATFKNGVSTAETKTDKNGELKEYDPGRKLPSFIPPPDSKNATLSAAGIKTYNYTQEGSGYKIEMTLVEEVGGNINYKPTHHSAVMDTLAINEGDLGDFTVENATVKYIGATIVAKVNAQGLLTSLSIHELANIIGQVGYKGVGGYDVVLDGDWKQDLTFTY